MVAAFPATGGQEKDLQQARDNLVYIEYFPKDAKALSFAKRDGDTGTIPTRLQVAQKGHERKQRKSGSCFKIENIDRRDYDDDDEVQARAGEKGAARNTSARAG